MKYYRYGTSLDKRLTIRKVLFILDRCFGNSALAVVQTCAATVVEKSIAEE